MKKTITFLSSLAISASLSAQLYVNQDGNVGVNMSNPTNISFGLNNDRTRYGMKTVLPRQKQLAGNHTLQIPISDLSKGTYFLTISSKNKTGIKKIIINK